MKRLLASVAISALALSGAAFAADAPTAVQKDQAPMTSSQTATPTAPSATAPAKPAVVDSQAKKTAVKKDKTSMNALSAGAVQQAQAPASPTTAKPADDGQAKKSMVVKKSDKKATTGTESAPSSAGKPATH